MELNEKIVNAKQKMAQHRREFSCREVDEPQDERLPEGQHLVNNFPVLDLGYKPKIELAEWTLTIDGVVDNPVTWTWEDFQSQPVSQVHADFHCVTTWKWLEYESYGQFAVRGLWWTGVEVSTCHGGPGDGPGKGPLPSARSKFMRGYCLNRMMIISLDIPIYPLEVCLLSNPSPRPCD